MNFRRHVNELRSKINNLETNLHSIAGSGGKDGLSGLYAGNAKRETARPTAERLLGAFQEVTLTVVKRGPQVYRQVTALSPLQERILDLLGFSSRVYGRLCTVSHEPL